MIVDANGALAARKSGTAGIVICGENTNLGGNRNVVADSNAAAIIETAFLVDGAVTAHRESATIVETGSAENETFLTDLKPHRRAIEKFAESMARQMTDDPIAKEEKPIEPD